jgi:hypothetical protein
MPKKIQYHWEIDGTNYQLKQQWRFMNYQNHFQRKKSIVSPTRFVNLRDQSPPKLLKAGDEGSIGGHLSIR